jgi:hypothetical protein
MCFIALFLSSCVFLNAASRKNIKTGLVADIALHGTEDGRFVWNFADASFAQRQRHVRDGCPDKHNDSTENACKKDFHLKIISLTDKRFARC